MEKGLISCCWKKDGIVYLVNVPSWAILWFLGENSRKFLFFICRLFVLVREDMRALSREYSIFHSGKKRMMKAKVPRLTNSCKRLVCVFHFTGDRKWYQNHLAFTFRRSVRSNKCYLCVPEPPWITHTSPGPPGLGGLRNGVLKNIVRLKSGWISEVFKQLNILHSPVSSLSLSPIRNPDHKFSRKLARLLVVKPSQRLIYASAWKLSVVAAKKYGRQIYDFSNGPHAHAPQSS